MADKQKKTMVFTRKERGKRTPPPSYMYVLGDVGHRTERTMT